MNGSGQRESSALGRQVWNEGHKLQQVDGGTVEVLKRHHVFGLAPRLSKPLAMSSFMKPHGSSRLPLPPTKRVAILAPRELPPGNGAHTGTSFALDRSRQPCQRCDGSVAILNAHLGIDPERMRFGGSLGNSKDASDLGVGLALRKPEEHFAFAGR